MIASQSGEPALACLHCGRNWALTLILSTLSPGAVEQTPPHRPPGRPVGNLHLEEQLALVSREHADSAAAPLRKRAAEPSLRDWQTQAQALLGSPLQASALREIHDRSHNSSMPAPGAMRGADTGFTIQRDHEALQGDRRCVLQEMGLPCNLCRL